MKMALRTCARLGGFAAVLALSACGPRPGAADGRLSEVAAGPVVPALSDTRAYREDVASLPAEDEAALALAPGLHGSDRYMIDGFRLPVEDQLDAGSCLYMAGTGIMEWLMNKQRGNDAPSVDGPTDLSERYTLTLASRYALANNFTDVVYLFRSGGRYQLDREARFLKQNGSTQVNWQAIDDRALPRHTDMPAFARAVIFTANGDQYANGVMTDADLVRIKTAVRERASPVLFVYHPPTVNWWHAAIIVGYDDEKQVFLTRDSAFGEVRTDAPAYGYGTATTADDGDYVDIFELSYARAKAWGNHASSYYLTP